MTSYILRRKGVGEKIGQMEEYSKKGLRVIRADRDLPEAPEYVFRWGSTNTVPRLNSTVFVNEASAIHWAYDKRKSRKQMADAGISMKTFVDFEDFLDWYSGGGIFTKMIVRPEHHIRSLDMNVCETVSDVYRACQKYSKYYISEYIQKDQEFRVFVLSGRVLAVVEKIPLNKNEVSWGCVEQGRFKYLPWMEWPLYATEKALQATELSGLDFGAVDVLSRSEGTSGAKNAYVLEINTAPELTPYYMETFVKGFDYILQNGKDKIPITGTSGSRSFKNYIHPVLTPYAA